MTRDQLITALQEAGYTKTTEGKTRVEVFTYVPKSDRPGAQSDIVEKFSKYGAVKLTTQQYSSIGHIEFESGWPDIRLIVKPDASKGLTTDEQESLAAYFIACKLKTPGTDYALSDFTGVNVESAFTAKELIEKASQGWIKSSKLMAEKVYELYRSSQYTICQRSDSSFVDNVSDRAQQLLKEADIKIGLDKWNPADIWMVKTPYLATDFSKFKSITELNQYLLKEFKAKNIIGVSLKQVATRVNTKVFNEVKSKIDISVDNISLGKTSFTKSIDGFINYNTTSSLVVRSFKPLAPVSGEITGKFAAGGKIGNGPLESGIKRYKPRFAITNKSEILREYKKNDIAYLRALKKRAEAIDTRLKQVSEGDFISQIVDKGPKLDGYLISKVQVLDVMEAVNSLTLKQKNELIQYVISYASSALDISSVFIKLYES